MRWGHSATITILSSTLISNFLLYSRPDHTVPPSEAADMFVVSQEGIKHEPVYQAAKSTLSSNFALKNPHATTVLAITSIRNGPSISFPRDSKSYTWLSPAASVSATSSPTSSDDIWDSPETPCGQSSKTTARGLLTPLTSPTPSRFRGRLILPPVPKLSFQTEANPVFKQQLLEKNDTSSEDDPFGPGKLFRNCTLTLEESE